MLSCRDRVFGRAGGGLGFVVVHHGVSLVSISVVVECQEGVWVYRDGVVGFSIFVGFSCYISKP